MDAKGSLCLVALAASLGCTSGRDQVAEDKATDTELANGHAEVVFENLGFATPESALYLPQEDVYLVSNINGEAGVKDDNGFISRLSPQGGLLELKWIDGASVEVTLNAPKGLATAGSELFVADIDAVRIFDLASGAPQGAIEIKDAAFLNDLVAAPDKGLYATDTAKNTVFQVLADRTYLEIAQSGAVPSPNGIALRGGEVWVVTWSEGKLVRLDKSGAPADEQKLPKAQLDGLVIMGDGTFLVSSWEEGAIYRGKSGSAFETALTGLSSPADIGYDTKRKLVLVPLFEKNKVVAVPLD